MHDMTGPATVPLPTTLCDAIALAMTEMHGATAVRIESAAYEYRTSFPVSRLDIVLSDGRVIAAVCKELSRSRLSADALRAKPAALFDPMREIEVYRRILRDAHLGTAALIAVAEAGPEGGPWLVIEQVRGVELYQVGDLAGWCAAAEWLARMHERLGWVAGDGVAAGHLLRLGPDDWRLMGRRALARGAGSAPVAARERLARSHDSVVARLEAMPNAFLHGDAYASNILVDDPVAPRRVCAVDWEMAAVGPALLDLAALTAGEWPLDAVAAMATAYRRTLSAPSPWRAGEETLRTALDACRCQLALQWLGWDSSWSPPREHRHDWLGTAMAALDGLGL